MKLPCPLMLPAPGPLHIFRGWEYACSAIIPSVTPPSWVRSPPFGQTVLPAPRGPRGEGRPYLLVVLFQALVVLAKGRQVDEGNDVLEAVDPLLALRLLPTDIHDPKGDQGAASQGPAPAGAGP